MGDFTYPDICYKAYSASHPQFLQCIDDNFLMQMVDVPTRRGGLLDLVLTNKKGLVEVVKVEGRLGSSNHEMAEFKISYIRIYNPKDIEDEILNYYKDTNQSNIGKDKRGVIIASVYNSLAESYAKYINSLKKLLNKDINKLCIVGGGTKDKLICELTKEKTNLTVSVGPIECTATGNILAQFKALGVLKDVEEMRKLVINSFDIKQI